MKILMLCDGMDTGGAETHILTLCDYLVRLGNDISVVSGGGSLVPLMRARGVSQITLPLGSRRVPDMLRCRAELSRLLKRGGFEVVHAHTRSSAFLVCDIARRRGIPLITTAHARFSLTPLRRALSRWGDRSIAVSQDLKQYLIESYGVAPENITVIHNGIDGERFYPLPRGCADSGITVGFLSRLDADSSLGAELLCAIAPSLISAYGELRIVIGGGGERLERIKELAERANSAIGERRVECVGEISDVPSFLRSCDIFVGVSRAAIEASLCSAAVVLCGNEGYSGILGEDNFLSSLHSNFCCRGEGVANEERLLSDLKSLIGEGKAEIFARGERLRKLSLLYCSADESAKRTEGVYRSALRLSDTHGGSLLCGYYGFGNMGDDILLRAAAERACEELGDKRVRALTDGGRRDSRRFGIACVCRHFPLSVIVEIARCKRLIFGGGTLLQSDTSRRSLIYYAALLIVARIFGKERILWGNGVGTLRGALERELIGVALGGCTYIGLRDMRSLALARHLIREREDKPCSVFLEPDLAESAKELYSDDERGEYLLSLTCGKERGDIVAAMPKGRIGEDEIFRLTKELSREKALGKRILLVAMNEAEDGRICRALSRSLEGKVLRGICFGDLVALLKRCERAYSMRLHGLVAAHLANTEFFGIGEDEKIKRYCAERGGRYISLPKNE